MPIVQASTNVEQQCELVLRSLPMWFGDENSLREYVEATSSLPTFVSTNNNAVTGFVSLRQHFSHSFEVTCIAVQSTLRGRGIGCELLKHASSWAAAEGGKYLQVKTIASAHLSAEYAQTRAFYASVGFLPLEIFPTLWSTEHPCLQLIKQLQNVA